MCWRCNVILYYLYIGGEYIMKNEERDEIPLIISIKPIVSPSFIACSHSREKGKLELCNINLEEGKKETIFSILTK